MINHINDWSRLNAESDLRNSAIPPLVKQETQEKKLTNTKIEKVRSLLDRPWYKHFDSPTQNAREGNFEKVRFFIEERGISPHEVIDNEGPLLNYAARSGNLTLVKYLVEVHKVHIEARGDLPGCKATALCKAAFFGHEDIVKYLIQKGASLNPNVSYSTLANNGVYSGKLKIVQLLIENGAKVDQGAVYTALEKGYLDIVKYFVQKGVDIGKKYGINPPCSVAALSGNLALFKYLIEDLKLNYLEQVDAWDSLEKSKISLLSNATKSGNVEFLRYLDCELKLDLVTVFKKTDEDLSYKYSLGRTFIGLACASKNVAMLQYFFEDKCLKLSVENLKDIKDQYPSYYGIQGYAYLLLQLSSDPQEKNFLDKIAKENITSLDGKLLIQLENNPQFWRFRDEIMDISLRLYHSYLEELNCDFTLVAENRKNIKVHSNILSLNGGNFFRALFETQLKENREKTIDLQKFSVATISAFIDFLYLGKVRFIEMVKIDDGIEELCLSELLEFAHTYEITPLVTCCVELIEKFATIHDLDVLNKIADLFENHKLQKLCLFLEKKSKETNIGRHKVARPSRP